MPIEFPCPYCSAHVRVPDNAGGKMGRCPKCTTRIRVPVASKVAKPTKSSAKSSAATEDPIEKIELPSDFVDPDSLEAPPDDEPILVDEPDQSLDDDAEDESPDAIDSPFPQEGISASPRVRGKPAVHLDARDKSRRVIKGRRAISTGVLLTICLVATAIAGAGIGAMILLSGPAMTGTMNAVIIEKPALPLRLMDARHSPLSADEQAEFLKKLQNFSGPVAETLVGAARVKYMAHPQGLAVQCEGGASSVLYRVAVRAHDKFHAFHMEKARDLEEARVKELTAHGGDPFRMAYYGVIKRQPMQTKPGELADLGLAQLTGGLGYCVTAKSGNKEYRCVYQDDLGLYFFLPAKVPEFELIGRKLPDGRALISASFKVIVGKDVGTVIVPKDSISMEKPNSEASAKEEMPAPDDSKPTEMKTPQ